MAANKIQIYPTRVEAVDETGDAIFRLETFDESSCKLDMHGFLSPDNIEETLDAIRQGVAILKLLSGPQLSAQEMTESRRQHIRVVLTEALVALKAIDPHLDANSSERSSLARHCIRWVLRAMDAPEGANDA